MPSSVIPLVTGNSVRPINSSGATRLGDLTGREKVSPSIEPNECCVAPKYSAVRIAPVAINVQWFVANEFFWVGVRRIFVLITSGSKLLKNWASRSNHPPKSSDTRWASFPSSRSAANESKPPEKLRMRPPPRGVMGEQVDELLTGVLVNFCSNTEVSSAIGKSKKIESNFVPQSVLKATAMAFVLGCTSRSNSYHSSCSWPPHLARRETR